MFLKNRNIISKMRRSKVTDYAALMLRQCESSQPLIISKFCFSKVFKAVSRSPIPDPQTQSPVLDPYTQRLQVGSGPQTSLGNGSGSGSMYNY